VTKSTIGDVGSASFRLLNLKPDGGTIKKFSSGNPILIGIFVRYYF
jgi:hypothetical protein